MYCLRVILFNKDKNMIMKVLIRLLVLVILAVFTGIFWRCEDPPVPYEGIAGRVIKIEYCATDTLVLVASDIPYPSNKRQYADTLTVNGVLYTGVIKTYDLSLRYQVLGEKIVIDFDVINSQPKECTGREAYKVPEAKILSVGLVNYKL
jgi:hypothetical protein